MLSKPFVRATAVFIEPHRAWVLKDEFNQVWDFSNVEDAQLFLKRWTTTALKSRLEHNALRAKE